MAPTILSDVSDEALGAASKKNLTEFFLGLRRAPAVEFVDNHGLARWMTHLPDAWFNGIYLGRLPLPGDKAWLDESDVYFAERRILAFSCWIDAELDRAPWVDILYERGYTYALGEPGMALVLADLPPVLPPPRGFALKTVESLPDLRTWCRVFLAVFGMPEAWATAMFNLMSGLGLDDSVVNYLGEMGGEPVATASVFYGAGVAGIGNIATVPAFRRLGIGGYCTLNPLYDARARGYRAAVLQASDLGRPVYERLGFRKVSDVDHFRRDVLPNDTFSQVPVRSPERP